MREGPDPSLELYLRDATPVHATCTNGTCTAFLRLSSPIRNGSPLCLTVHLHSSLPLERDLVEKHSIISIKFGPHAANLASNLDLIHLVSVCHVFAPPPAQQHLTSRPCYFPRQAGRGGRLRQPHAPSGPAALLYPQRPCPASTAAHRCVTQHAPGPNCGVQGSGWR